MTVSLRDYPGSHFNMCNGANGSCFTPWCSCPCHHWTGPMEPAEPGPAVVGRASPATHAREVSPEARRYAIAAIGRRMTWPSLHWRDLGHTDAHAAIVDLLIDEGWGPVSGAVRPTREALAEAIWPVLFNASNYPGKASMAILGQNIGPLRDKIVAALLAAGHLWAEQPAEAECLCLSADGFSTPMERAHEACPVHAVPVPSVPVVDREALANLMRAHELDTKDYSRCVCDGFVDGDDWDEHLADVIAESGLFVDRAVVEADVLQLAADALWRESTTEGGLDSVGWLRSRAAAIRAGGVS